VNLENVPADEHKPGDSRIWSRKLKKPRPVSLYPG